MKRTHVFVDGFNLYYGCLKASGLKWLDIRRLCNVLLRDAYIEKIYYFTARVKPRSDDPTQNSRQDTYLRALKTLDGVEIIFGHFLSHPVRMQKCDARGNLIGETVRVLKTEEKGSDVNLASYLLRGAFRDEFEQAVLITNDSDLKAPLQIIRTDLGKRVGLLNPHQRQSLVLAENADFFRQIRPGALRVSQFPAELTDTEGSFRKPSSW